MEIRKCKYCGTEVRNKYMCEHCAKKLKLVKQLLAMVRKYKAEIQKNGDSNNG